MAYDFGLADRVRSILQAHAGFSERKMFGGLCFMINGHMCCGVMKTDLHLRLAPGDATAALGQPHTRPMEFTGKPMKSMILVDSVGVDSDEALRGWVELAFGFARTLPPKTSSAARPRRPSRLPTPA
jgi:TfoX/Sxy family transcriptional regulator of competence genes